jgi:hypothetical protein
LIRSDPVPRTNQASSRQEPSLDEIANTSEKSFSETPPAVESNQAAVSSSNSISHVLFDAENSNLRPRPSDIADGINLYFKYCHRQPIWCFERDEVSEYGMLPEELSFSILALTSRFSDKRDQLQVYSDSAKTLVMLHIANGMVELTTIESLCLLSYSSFIGKYVPICLVSWCAEAIQTAIFISVSFIWALPSSSVARPCWTWSRHMPLLTERRSGRRGSFGVYSYWSSTMVAKMGS